MHAVVVKVTLQDREAAEAELHDQVIPQVSQAPGFVAGSEDAATGVSEVIRLTRLTG